MEDEWFAVRVWREGIDAPNSVAWTKEQEYMLPLREAGEYTWQIVICRGDPATAICEQLALSETESFAFAGCPSEEGSPPPAEPTPTG